MAFPRRVLAAVIGGLAVAGAVRAEETKPLEVAFNLGAATNYEFRGISQTSNRGEIFGGLDATIERIGYAGVWLSNVDFSNGTRAEYDIYGGVKPTLGPVTLDLGLIRYGYTNQPPGPTKTYTEWKLAPSMPLGPATIGLAYFYTDHFSGRSGAASYYELNGYTPIGSTAFSVSGALGRRAVAGPGDYATWNLGLGYALNSRLGFDLRYWDTDKHGFGSVYRPRIVVSAKAVFP